MSHINNHSPIAASRIIISAHAKERACQRLNLTAGSDIRTIAARARNKGIRYSCLNLDNYKYVGLTYRQFVSFKKKVRQTTNTERIYLYNGYVWIFRGNKALNLVTVYPLQEDMSIPEEQGTMRPNLNKINYNKEN